MKAGQGWSMAEDDIIRANHKTKSARELMAQLPSRSRNAIIGRAHRIGCCLNGTTINPGTKPARRVNGKRQRAETRKAMKPSRGTLLEIAKAARQVLCEMPVPENAPLAVPFLSLRDNSCKWPVGDLFCDADRLVRDLYCPYHERYARDRTKRRKVSADLDLGRRVRVHTGWPE